MSSFIPATSIATATTQISKRNSNDDRNKDSFSVEVQLQTESILRNKLTIRDVNVMHGEIKAVGFDCAKVHDGDHDHDDHNHSFSSSSSSSLSSPSSSSSTSLHASTRERIEAVDEEGQIVDPPHQLCAKNLERKVPSKNSSGCRDNYDNDDTIFSEEEVVDDCGHNDQSDDNEVNENVNVPSLFLDQNDIVAFQEWITHNKGRNRNTGSHHRVRGLASVEMNVSVETIATKIGRSPIIVSFATTNNDNDDDNDNDNDDDDDDDDDNDNDKNKCISSSSSTIMSVSGGCIPPDGNENKLHHSNNAMLTSSSTDDNNANKNLLKYKKRVSTGTRYTGKSFHDDESESQLVTLTTIPTSPPPPPPTTTIIKRINGRYCQQHQLGDNNDCTNNNGCFDFHMNNILDSIECGSGDTSVQIHTTTNSSPMHATTDTIYTVTKNDHDSKD